MYLQDVLMQVVNLLLNPSFGTDIVNVDRRKGILELGNLRASKPTDLGELKDENCPKDENADAIEHMVQTTKTAA
jgi:hypothetical protein